MLKAMIIPAAIIASAISSGTEVAADTLPIASVNGSEVRLHLVRDKPRIRSFSSTATQAGEPCGVWRCTWRTGDGGCLVWEKTKCKVINPFD